MIDSLKLKTSLLFLGFVLSLFSVQKNAAWTEFSVDTSSVSSCTVNFGGSLSVYGDDDYLGTFWISLWTVGTTSGYWKAWNDGSGCKFEKTFPGSDSMDYADGITISQYSASSFWNGEYRPTTHESSAVNGVGCISSTCGSLTDVGDAARASAAFSVMTVIFSFVAFAFPFLNWIKFCSPEKFVMIFEGLACFCALLAFAIYYGGVLNDDKGAQGLYDNYKNGSDLSSPRAGAGLILMIIVFIVEFFALVLDFKSSGNGGGAAQDKSHHPHGHFI